VSPVYKYCSCVANTLPEYCAVEARDHMVTHDI
jgi:hypothetical protein